MATVSLRFPPSPDLVRTARLVVVAAARRSRFDEGRLDELRLAVGEICARAVRRCAAGIPPSAVDPRLTVEVEDDDRCLVVRVVDPAEGPAGGAVDGAAGGAAGEDDDLGEDVVLALVRGLADRVELGPGPGGPDGTVVMTWNRP
jgi:anti-sigma regulatory factor (Ser/Thr protein kinase)